MLGLSGKEHERDNRFFETLPLSAEKTDPETTATPVQRKKSFITRSLERYRQLPLLSRIVSILASLWIIFASMRIVHQGFARGGRHGARKHNWVGAPFEEPIPIDVTFNPTVHLGVEEIDSKTSLPLYLQPYQALEVSWDQDVKGSLSIQEDDTELQQAYLVLQTSEDTNVDETSFVEAFATQDRLFIRFKASEGEDIDSKTYNVILRVPSTFEVMPPIILRGAEATLDIPESMQEIMFPYLEIDSLLSGFEANNLQVGLLRVSSGTGDISGTFNVSHELDLKTSTGNITAKVNLHKPSFPPPPHKPGKHDKHHKHPKHRGPPGRGPTGSEPPSRFGKRWFWPSSEEDVEAADPFTEDEIADEDSFDFGEKRPPPGENLPPPPPDHRRPGPPDHRRPPPPDHRRPPPPHDRRPPFPPQDRRPPLPAGPDQHHHHPPPLVRVHASSSTGNIHLTYLNHLEEAALVSSVYSDTGKVHVKLAEDYKGKFKAGVKVGQVVLANERDKTLIIDREVKTPTGAFVEGFVKSGNDTEGCHMSNPLKIEGDERFAVEREFDMARMAGGGPPPPFPRGPDQSPRGKRHGHRGPDEPHRRPDGPPRGPPHGHPYTPPPFHHAPPPGFGFSASFSTVGEVKLTF